MENKKAVVLALKSLEILTDRLEKLINKGPDPKSNGLIASAEFMIHEIDSVEVTVAVNGLKGLMDSNALGGHSFIKDSVENVVTVIDKVRGLSAGLEKVIDKHLAEDSVTLDVVVGVEDTMNNLAKVLDRVLDPRGKLPAALRESSYNDGLAVAFKHSAPGSLEINVISPDNELLLSFNEMSDDYAITNASEFARDWNKKNVAGYADMVRERASVSRDSAYEM